MSNSGSAAAAAAVVVTTHQSSVIVVVVAVFCCCINERRTPLTIVKSKEKCYNDCDSDNVLINMKIMKL
jgi:hypothetical protein